MFPDLSLDNCAYRGEGNASLVVQLIKDEKILRLIKYDIILKSTHSLQEKHEALQKQLSFAQNVMRPLLGENFVYSPEIVFVFKEDIENINSLCNPQRPGVRLQRIVPEEDSYALVIPDFCTLPLSLKHLPIYGQVLAVEIKPKQGFLCSAEFYSSNLEPKPLIKCRYCMHQHYKLKENVISTKSAYCPTDLFSGCPQRVEHAVKMLVDTPQNNFRVFVDQKLSYSQEKMTHLNGILLPFFTCEKSSRCTDLLSSLIVQALLRPFPGSSMTSHSEKQLLKNCPNAAANCTIDCRHELPPDCVLCRILKVQMMDTLFAKNVYPLYLRIKHEIDDNRIGCLWSTQIPHHVGEMNRVESESEDHYLSRKVWEFLVALTAKDCSIMLAFQKCTEKVDSSNNPNVICDPIGQTYVFSVAIADLDAKSPAKIEKQYKMVPLILQSNLNS